MGDLSTKERHKLRSNQFAYVDSEGDRHLPLNDESHVRNAMARFGQTDFESKTAKHKAAEKIVRAAKREGIDIDRDDDVVKSAKAG